MPDYVSRLSHINTGRLYMTTLSTYEEKNPYGLVCSGNRNYTVMNFDAVTSKKQSPFGDWVCQSTGFETAAFVGTKKAYLKFMGNMFGRAVKKYLGRALTDDCQPDFAIAGVNCNIDSLDSEIPCRLLDYRDHGECSFVFFILKHTFVQVEIVLPSTALFLFIVKVA